MHICKPVFFFYYAWPLSWFPIHHLPFTIPLNVLPFLFVCTSFITDWSSLFRLWYLNCQLSIVFFFPKKKNKISLIEAFKYVKKHWWTLSLFILSTPTSKMVLTPKKEKKNTCVARGKDYNNVNPYNLFVLTTLINKLWHPPSRHPLQSHLWNVLCLSSFYIHFPSSYLECQLSNNVTEHHVTTC